MNTYRVEIGFGFQVYEVEADNMEDAEDQAWVLFDANEATGGDSAFVNDIQEVK